MPLTDSPLIQDDSAQIQACLYALNVMALQNSTCQADQENVKACLCTQLDVPSAAAYCQPISDNLIWQDKVYYATEMRQSACLNAKLIPPQLPLLLLPSTINSKVHTAVLAISPSTGVEVKVTGTAIIHKIFSSGHESSGSHLQANVTMLCLVVLMFTFFR
ncbi:hypothetical protein BC830DRAFT_1150049, partial [Chytriomyces sp. MP71]